MTQKVLTITAFINRDTKEVYRLSRDLGHPNEYVHVNSKQATYTRSYLSFESCMTGKQFDIHKIKLLV